MLKTDYLAQCSKNKILYKWNEKTTTYRIQAPHILVIRPAAAVASVVSNSVWLHRWQPTRLPRPWDSPGKNTGVGCHFLLQCIKVKSESEVTPLCLTLSDPMDCSPSGSSIHGIFQARVLEWGAIAFSLVSAIKEKNRVNFFFSFSSVSHSVLSDFLWPGGL